MSSDSIFALGVALANYRDALKGLEERIRYLESREKQITQRLSRLETQGTLEAAAVIKSQAAQQQATNTLGTGQPAQLSPGQALYAPLRNDTKAVLDLAAFARRLLMMDDLGLQCSALVRDAAREALGMKKMES